MMQDNNTTIQEPKEPEVIRTTDADTVKELVEMKFLAKKKNIRLRTPTQIICQETPMS